MTNPSALSAALAELGTWLRHRNYAFTAVTPLTHTRVLRRPPPAAPTLRDVFGWNHPFESLPEFPAALRDLCVAKGLLRRTDVGFAPQVRFATLDGLLFAHSPFPTQAVDSVFFGPDSYRFARAIAEHLRMRPLGRAPRILEIGAGAGPGGLVAARHAPAGARIVLADINPLALAHCAANAEVNDLPQVSTVLSDVVAAVEGDFDLIVSNPPYLVDAAERAYRHGGGTWGERLSVRIAEESLVRLRPGGALLLYTGAAVVAGIDRFRAALRPVLDAADASFFYEELDPDVFGEELDTPAYATADRIAAVRALFIRNGHAHSRHR